MMKESLIYIDTNVEFVVKFKKNSKDHRLQYIENLPKN